MNVNKRDHRAGNDCPSWNLTYLKAPFWSVYTVIWKETVKDEADNGAP